MRLHTPWHLSLLRPRNGLLRHWPEQAQTPRSYLGFTKHYARWCLISSLLLALFASFGIVCAQSNIDVEGMGFLQNRALKSRLAFLQSLDAEAPASLDAALLEDSAFLLIEQLKRDGYLQPTIKAELVEGDAERTITWTSPYTIQLDADAAADEVVFQVDPGVMAQYESVEIDGITAITADELQRYFMPGGALLQTRRSKVYTPENLDRRAGRVLQSLEAMGYPQAELVEGEVDIDPVSGAAQVSLRFDQGARHYVGAVTLIRRKDGAETREKIDLEADTILTREWEQTLRSEYRNEAFSVGYPDVRIAFQRDELSSGSDGRRVFDIRILADWGAPVTLGSVRFKGDEVTRRATLRRQLDLDTGEPLNRLEVEESRRKMMGLGIYKRVDLTFEPPTGEVRDVVYSLEPGLRKELKLLAGWGSYEQLRAGFNWEHRNPFGRAHRYEIEAKQSLKSTRAELGYSIPQIFGTDVLLYSNAEYSYREEIAYERTTQGVSFGTSYSTAGGLRLAAEYGYFQEDADRDDELSFESEENATVASLSFSVSYDQRDDFLVPGSGWNVFSEFEIANRWLGGSVNFQKLELGGSYHLPVSESTLLHFGLRAGTILTDGESEKNIPFNDRFFHGGENSVRGYQQGEASPLDDGGDPVGAETYALFNFEMEQRVYSKFSLVLFSDTVLNARDGSFGGDGQTLTSLGLGLRYQTVVGPVRLEYGHNLNPRESDPDGTLHLSVGFPF